MTALFWAYVSYFYDLPRGTLSQGGGKLEILSTKIW